MEGEGGLGGLYAGHQTARPESASSASPPSMNHAHFPGFPPPTSGGMLVVPQPINASKVGHGRATNDFCASRPESNIFATGPDVNICFEQVENIISFNHVLVFQ